MPVSVFYVISPIFWGGLGEKVMENMPERLGDLESGEDFDEKELRRRLRFCRCATLLSSPT